MKKRLYIPLFVCALSSMLFAQSAGMPPGRADWQQNRLQFLTSQLSLTADQQKQATTIFSNQDAAMTSVRANLKNAHQSLEDAVKSNNLTSIEQLSSTIGNLMGQMTAAEAKARAAFYQVLTPDQQSKLTQIESQRPFQSGMRPGVHGAGR
ncbi:MAG: Spy/CpxP family protein refolding chaperone [Bryobacteraceae bacterium]